VKTFRVVGVDGESPEAALLWDLGCLGLIEERTASGPAVMAYFDARVETGLTGTWDDILDVDDVAIYRAGLGPIRVGRLVVAPSHAEVEATDGDIILWLDPGSAFGTGHHETTRLALASLERSDLGGKTVIDVGSGTGLLALAADRLGAERVIGIDVDAATLKVARENAARNFSRARFAHGSLGETKVGRAIQEMASKGGNAGHGQGPGRAVGLPNHADVIVANLYAELHAELMPLYARTLLPGGRAYITGILNVLRQTVLSKVAPWFTVVNDEVDGEWTLFELERRPDDPDAR